VIVIVLLKYADETFASDYVNTHAGYVKKYIIVFTAST